MRRGSWSTICDTREGINLGMVINAGDAVHSYSEGLGILSSVVVRRIAMLLLFSFVIKIGRKVGKERRRLGKCSRC